MGASIEDFSYRLETLLASCIPNLKLEGNVLYFDQQRPEFYSNSHLVIVHKLILAHSVHQTRFSDCRISDNDKLKHVLWLWT